MDVYFDEVTRTFISGWQKIRKSMAHRPFNAKSKEHQAFIKKTIEQLNEFSNMVDISQELQLLKSQLI
jgi:tripartite-type tricarboxylate transporter receptor subunit TctC